MRRFSALALAVLLLAPSAFAQISTDRPGFGSSTAPVGQGVFQAELGVVEASLLDFGDDTVTFTNTPLFVRYGIADLVELRAGTNLVSAVFGRGDSEFEVGFDSFVFGTKIALPFDGLTASVQPEIVVNDSFDDAFFNVEVNAGYPLGETLSASGFAIVTTDFDVTTTTLAANLASVFGPTLTGYAEAGIILNDADNQLVVGAGLLAQVTPDVQLDFSAQVPLDDTPLTALLAFGASFRVR